jgi:hypothetical protein
MSVTVNASQLRTLLRSAIVAGINVLVTGAPGIGKSEIGEQAAADEGADLILEHPAVDDPTDFKGLPFDGGDHADFKPFGNFNRALKAKKRTVWFFDDLGQASTATQAAAMQLLLARRVNGHKLPDHVTFIAATNRRTDRAGVAGILEPVKSRFGTIVELVPHIDDWSKWAFDHNVNPMLIAFLRMQPDLLCNFSATADLTNSPLPRTWNNLSKLEALNLPAEVETAAFAGAVGEGAATQYLVFRQMYKSLVNIDAILADPANAKIPDKVDQLYAVSVGLAARANDKTFGRIVQYATRVLKEANRGEFAVLTVRDSLRKDPEVANTEAYTRMSAGPIGDLIAGK